MIPLTTTEGRLPVYPLTCDVPTPRAAEGVARKSFFSTVLTLVLLVLLGATFPRLDAAEEEAGENAAPDDLAGVYEEASEARQAGRYEDQKTLLERIRGKGDLTQNYLILIELANCCRSLDRLREARRYAAEAIELLPDEPTGYLTLAIMEKNSGQLDAALRSLTRARERSRNALMTLQLDLVAAGYLYHAKQTEAAQELFARVQPIVETDASFTVNLAWFYAVSGQEEKFYAKLERALDSNPEAALRWVETEADLDRYRGEERFKGLVENANDILAGW